MGSILLKIYKYLEKITFQKMFISKVLINLQFNVKM
jgi:hypothetical protein